LHTTKLSPDPDEDRNQQRYGVVSDREHAAQRPVLLLAPHISVARSSVA